MRSPTSSEDSRLVRIGVPCAQTRLPGPRGPREMHSRARASGASAARFDRPARQATEPRAKREVMSALCQGRDYTLSFRWTGNAGYIITLAKILQSSLRPEVYPEMSDSIATILD